MATVIIWCIVRINIGKIGSDEVDKQQMYEFIYIIAISLQLAGALVLVVNFWNGKLKNTVAKGLKDEESVLHWIEVDEDSQSITYSPEEQQKVANRVLRNRFAFIYIAIGYLLGVTGRFICRNWFNVPKCSF